MRLQDVKTRIPMSLMVKKPFNIIRIEKTDRVSINNQTIFNITTKEKFKIWKNDNALYNKFFTSNRFIVRHLSKKDTVNKLKRDKSIGPFICGFNGQSTWLSGTLKDPPRTELHHVTMNNDDEIIIGEPVLAKHEVEKMKNEILSLYKQEHGRNP